LSERGFQTVIDFLYRLLLLLLLFSFDKVLLLTYTQGTDFISDTGEVRRLARNVIPADFTNDQITVYQYEVYSGIGTITGKHDWDALDVEFGSLQLVEKEIAALEIKKHFADSPEQEAVIDGLIDSAWARFKENIVGYQETETGDESSSILETDYKSWNLNSDVDPPNRLRNVGITEVDF